MSTEVHARRVVAPVALSLFSVAANFGTSVAVLYPLAASAQIDEVIVTTRRREESLQDVPIAVSAISSEQLLRQGVTDLRRTVELQPSVQFDQAFGPADNRITIRGLSNTRGRSNVAFLIDGIDVTTENLVTAGSGLLANRRLLSDVERIEIVKGPQSALYGRAAFAGALSYTTKDPGDEFQGRVGLDIGDYGRRNFDVAFGGPVTDTLGLRVTGTMWNEDGFYSNSVTGQAIGQQEGYAFAVKSVWKPADGIKSTLRAEYSDEEFGPRPVVRLPGTEPVWFPNGGPRFQDGLGNVLPGGDARVLARPIITGNVFNQDQTGTATNLFNFGLYCPDRPDLIGQGNVGRGFDPTQDPGFCLPKEIGRSSGLRPSLSADPVTGGDFQGTTTETFRVSFVNTFDVGVGTFSSYTGWTDFVGDDIYDQDYQNAALGFQLANTTTETNQFSQEIRFASAFDGPVNFTVGALFWDEQRLLKDRNLILACAPIGRVSPQPLVIDGQPVLRDPNGITPALGESAGPDGIVGTADDVNNPVDDVPVLDNTTGTIIPINGVCDGTNGSVSSIGQLYQQVLNSNFFDRPVIWEADTRHWSFYGAIDWNLTDELQLTFETRFVDEKFTLLRPSSSSCTEIGFAQGSNALPILDNDQIILPPGETLASLGIGADPTICDADRVRLNIGPLPAAANGVLNWRTIEGSTNSRFNTPKVTLKWQPLDDLNLYFSYGFAQKPGGINQLAAGGAPTTIENERFAPEKLKAWEIGMKSRFEAAGFWQFNMSGFFQDYTDKQVGIQFVDASGLAAPKVVNASGAEVWGLEFDALWQPSVMDGLTFTLSGTLLDAQYSRFVDDTTNLVKVARVGYCNPVWKGPGGESTDPNSAIARNPISSKFCRIDYSGNDLERTPAQSYAASMTIQRPFLETEYEYLFQVEGSWQDKRASDPENLLTLKDYAIMNMRLGLTSDQWEVLAYVDNVLDQDTFTTGGSGPDFGRQVSQLGFTAGFGTSHFFATLPDPRVFGVRANYRFGAGR
jgi:outer membrane receptor protein involved in Fe transport